MAWHAAPAGSHCLKGSWPTVAATALAPAVTGQSASGDYRIELVAADNPGWVSGGALALGEIDNIALVVGYSFTPRG